MTDWKRYRYSLNLRSILTDFKACKNSYSFAGGARRLFTALYTPYNSVEKPESLVVLKIRDKR